MNCPLCGDLLVKQSREDAGGSEPMVYCQREVKLIGDKRIFNHYREDPEIGTVVMYVSYYRIINHILDSHEHSNIKNYTEVGIHRRYKTKAGKKTNAGEFYFKQILICPLLHPDTEEKLRSRINLLVLMS